MSRLSCAAAVAFVVVACSSSPPDFVDPDVPGRDENPDGVPYPTDHLGRNERAGRRPGDRIPNFTFQAYIDGDRAGGLKTVSLADYYDPDQKRHKVLHLQVAATWCAYCSAEVTATVKVKDELGAEGAVFLEVIVAGPAVLKGPALEEVDDWIERHKTNFTVGIDVRARRLASMGVDGTVMPWDMLIDTRTMEILDSSGGAPADVVAYVREGLKFANSQPAARY
ncbi:MAG: redoxin domain-containing protein [Labilithrix sp.]|nr:redoxin domain-containing protein [Labilithrix sp.]